MMTIAWNPHDVIEREIADAIRGNDWFKRHRITVIEQNEADYATLMKKNLAQIGGIVVMVELDSMTNLQTACEVEVSLVATEAVPINRARQGFVTAIDAIQAATQVLDGEWWRWDDLKHTSPAEGVLEATTHLRGLIKRVEPSDPTERDENIKGD